MLPVEEGSNRGSSAAVGCCTLAIINLARRAKLKRNKIIQA